MVESGAAARIESREQFLKWLEKQPGEEGRRIAVLLAARAALRVLPLVVDSAPPRGGRERLGQFVALNAASFRATALARVAGKYPTRANGLADADAAARAAYAAYAARADAADAAADAAAYAARAAARAAYAARAAAADAAAAAAADAAAAAADAAAAWDALNADIAALAAHRVAALADAPLWLAGASDWATARWAKLRAALPPNENWQVWIEWYDDRLAGRARGEAHELVFASVPREEWDKGPAAANAWIREHLLPREDPAGASIDSKDGRAAIRSAGGDDDFAAADQPQTRQLHERVRQRAAEARAAVGPLSNYEGFGTIAANVDEFYRLVAVDDTRDIAANISTAWELSAAIGTFIERDDAVRAGKGGLTPEMDAGPREALDQLITVASAFVRRFPTARTLDADVRESRRPRESVDAARPIYEEAKAEALIETHTTIILDIAVEASERSDGIQAEKNRAWFTGTTRNIVLWIAAGSIAIGGAFVTGAAKKAGEHFWDKSHIGQRGDDFLLRQEKDIEELFKDHPADLRVWLRNFFRRLHESMSKRPGGPEMNDP